MNAHCIGDSLYATRGTSTPLNYTPQLGFPLAAGNPAAAKWRAGRGTTEHENSKHIMAVYVDDMRAPFSRMVMCHMLADSDEELHAMAARIGVARKWWQSPEKTSGSHYDIALCKRSMAVGFGAIEITLRQACAMNTRRRVTGVLGSPEDAIEWAANYRAKRRAAAAGLPAPAPAVRRPTSAAAGRLGTQLALEL